MRKCPKLLILPTAMEKYPTSTTIPRKTTARSRSCDDFAWTRATPLAAAFWRR